MALNFTVMAELFLIWISYFRCTVELLSTVLPEYLESPVKTRRLTDPHGTAVAKVVVTCLYACLSRCGILRPFSDLKYFL